MTWSVANKTLVLQACQLLVRAGAVPAAFTLRPARHTALDLALERGHVAVARYLQLQGAGRGRAASAPGRGHRLPADPGPHLASLTREVRGLKEEIKELRESGTGSMRGGERDGVLDSRLGRVGGAGEERPESSKGCSPARGTQCDLTDLMAADWSEDTESLLSPAGRTLSQCYTRRPTTTRQRSHC